MVERALPAVPGAERDRRERRGRVVDDDPGVERHGAVVGLVLAEPRPPSLVVERDRGQGGRFGLGGQADARPEAAVGVLRLAHARGKDRPVPPHGSGIGTPEGQPVREPRSTPRGRSDAQVALPRPRIEQLERLVLRDRAALHPQLEQVGERLPDQRARAGSPGASSPAPRRSAAAARSGSPPRPGGRSAPPARPAAARACAHGRRSGWCSRPGSAGSGDRAAARRRARSAGRRCRSSRRRTRGTGGGARPACGRPRPSGWSSAAPSSAPRPSARRRSRDDGTARRPARSTASSACRCRAAAPASRSTRSGSHRSTTAYVCRSTSLC